MKLKGTSMSTQQLINHYKTIRQRLRGPVQPRADLVNPVHQVKVPTVNELSLKLNFVLTPFGWKGTREWDRAVIRQCSFDYITRRVCEDCQVSRAEIWSDRRPKRLSQARHLVWALAYDLTPHSLPKIGRMSGGRDHTTIIHGIQQGRKHHLFETLRDELR